MISKTIAKRVRAYRRREHKNKFVGSVEPITPYFDERTYETKWSAREWEFGERVGVSIDIKTDEITKYDRYIYRIGSFQLALKNGECIGLRTGEFIDSVDRLLGLYGSITLVGFNMAELDQTLNFDFKSIANFLGLNIKT